MLLEMRRACDAGIKTKYLVRCARSSVGTGEGGGSPSLGLTCCQHVSAAELS